MPYRDTSSHRDPALSMGEMLLSLSTSRDDSTNDLVDVLPCRFDEVTLPMLGAAFFDRGLLGPREFNIRPSDTVAPGDVGYVTEDGVSVAVANIHRSLQTKSGALLGGESGVP